MSDEAWDTLAKVVFWTVIGAIVIWLLVSCDKERQRECDSIFAAAQTQRDTLDVVLRSNVYGGSRCRLPSYR